MQEEFNTRIKNANKHCQILDCYHMIDNKDNSIKKNCGYCSYDYKKVHELADKIREEILNSKIVQKRINIRAKLTEYMIFILVSFFIIYLLSFMYFKLKNY